MALLEAFTLTTQFWYSAVAGVSFSDWLEMMGGLMISVVPPPGTAITRKVLS
jgi:hypothetical protein